MMMRLLSFISLLFYFLYYRGVSVAVWSFSESISTSSAAGGIRIENRGPSKKIMTRLLSRNDDDVDVDKDVDDDDDYNNYNEESGGTPSKIKQTKISLFAGFDLGTSGARISILEPSSSLSAVYREIYSDSIAWKDCVNLKNSHGYGATSTSDAVTVRSEGRYDDPDSWWIAIETLLEGCSHHVTVDNNNNTSRKSYSLLDHIASICVSGTSASCLVVDRTTLEVTRKPRMYDYDIITSSSNHDNDNAFTQSQLFSSITGLRASELLQKHLPSKHTAKSHSGSFAKLIKWILESPLQTNEKLCHQSDYISSKLLFPTKNDNRGVGIGMGIQSDWHNCLKLGYDVRNQCWPLDDWMESCFREAIGISNNKNSNNTDNGTTSILQILPAKVISPGLMFGTINERIAKKLGLSKDVIITSGTTDSNAAFFAAASGLGSNVGKDCSGNINKGSVDNYDIDGNDITDNSEIRIPYGTAVTSLGSTTAIKFLSKTYIEDSTLGVYSHRFPSRKVFSTATNNNSDESEEQEAWLVGGASNVGCAVFRALNFTDDELRSRSMDIDPTTDSEAYLLYKYYPLLPNKVGERFPIADSTKQSVLEPIPADRSEYMKGLFQSISTEVERKGYETLRDLGSNPPFPTQIMTAGGGSQNTVWTSLRQRIMNDNNTNADIDGIENKIDVRSAEHSEASFGAAMLAAAGFRQKGGGGI
mmetsp:Transcript_25426/g.28975  ORF Transcript_25426/g.28975 Transcript_25426/m.28975 type:complete len:702 (-) Transcript_25426:3993-6098(-)